MRTRKILDELGRELIEQGKAGGEAMREFNKKLDHIKANTVFPSYDKTIAGIQHQIENYGQHQNAEILKNAILPGVKDTGREAWEEYRAIHNELLEREKGPDFPESDPENMSVAALLALL